MPQCASYINVNFFRSMARIFIQWYNYIRRACGESLSPSHLTDDEKTNDMPLCVKRHANSQIYALVFVDF